jgi:hypothetical protein
MFIEVNSLTPKNCKIIINIENVIEIAPLVAGGCVLYFSTLESGSPRTITVKDDYSMFSQFVLQTVKAEDIARKFPKVNKKEDTNIKSELSSVQLNIPSFGGSVQS